MRLVFPRHSDLLTALVPGIVIWSLAACSSDGGMRGPGTHDDASGGRDDGPNAAAPAPSHVSAGPQPSPGTRAVETVGMQGGALAVGDFAMAISPGSVSEEKQIVVSIEQSLPSPVMEPPYSPIYRLEPSGSTFDKPLEVRIPFSGDPASAVVYLSKPGQPDQLEVLPATIEGAFAKVQVSHFSWLFVAGKCFVGILCPCKTTQDCAKHEDGNLCNGILYCNEDVQPARCEVHPLTIPEPCDSSTSPPCEKNACDWKTGQCKPQKLADNAWCDDDDVCTTGEKCVAGVCKGGAEKCECKADGDCGVKEDGNLCNGILYCDKGGSPYTCLINPGTVVECPSAGDTTCSKSKCAAKTGKCGMVPEPDGTTCSDSEVCTANDACKVGLCAPGPFVCECNEDADCAVKEDGNLCNGTLYCHLASATCMLNPATVVSSCPSVNDTACQRNTCDPKTGKCGMVHEPDGTKCTDANMCTTGDACKAGFCAPGPFTCECKSDLDCGGKTNGNLCNGLYYCDHAAGACKLNAATVVTCPTVDDTQCAKNQCVPSTGKCEMKPVQDGAPCSDGNFCTASDACQAGACVPGASTCDCQVDADCAAKEDGNLCNGTLYCDKAMGLCKLNPATIVTCPSGNDTSCAKNQCAPSTGKCAMTPEPMGKICDDLNPCTMGDACQSGECFPGAPICECQANADCAAKEDGNLCNGTLYCDKEAVPFTCKVNPATVVTWCHSTNDTTCAKNRCRALTGTCVMADYNEGLSCDNGNALDFEDTCKVGVCTGRTPSGGMMMDVSCTTDADCTKWEDGNLCNGTTFCDLAQGRCDLKESSKIVCSPTQDTECSYNACNPTTGVCSMTPRFDGTSCNANAGVCSNGSCL